MNREDVIRIAKEVWGDDSGKPWHESALVHLEAFAKLVAAAEREACAKMAENRWLDKANCTAEEMYEMQKKSIADAIRARREQ